MIDLENLLQSLDKEKILIENDLNDIKELKNLVDITDINDIQEEIFDNNPEKTNNKNIYIEEAEEYIPLNKSKNETSINK